MIDGTQNKIQFENDVFKFLETNLYLELDDLQKTLELKLVNPITNKEKTVSTIHLSFILPDNN